MLYLITLKRLHRIFMIILSGCVSFLFIIWRHYFIDLVLYFLLISYQKTGIIIIVISINIRILILVQLHNQSYILTLWLHEVT